MSSAVVNDIHNAAIDDLIQSSVPDVDTYNNNRQKLGWVPYSAITKIESSQIDNIYYAMWKHKMHRRTETTEHPIMLLLLGSSEECTPTLVSEFARIYSLPTHKRKNYLNHFKRYSTWLEDRNSCIKGFTEHDDNYYMVADRNFDYFYSQYGFCTACGVLRCSLVWCICGHKQLSNGWTSNNKQLDELIKKSQVQTKSPNDAYLEWIPYDRIGDYGEGGVHLSGPPATVYAVSIPLEITDETDDSYYAELCDMYPDMLTTDVWDTIGFTYDASKRKYCLLKEYHDHGLCLGCAIRHKTQSTIFCYHCKAPIPLDWTTGNKSLDSFIMESWNNTKTVYDAYILWVEYSLLTNVQELTSLRHGCTYAATWSERKTNKLTRVTLKKMVNKVKGDDQLLDFYQLTKEYPEILTPDNIWIIGATQEPSTREYYLVFHYNVCAILDRFMRRAQYVNVKYMWYSDFYEFKEIGSGSDATVYTAKYRWYSDVRQETIVLKQFKSFNERPELFISEFRNLVKCSHVSFNIYGITQNPETKEYMVVMQYANKGSLLSYLDRNINKLTWKDKLWCLQGIPGCLNRIHNAGLVHCNLHGGTIVLHDADGRRDKTYIHDLGLSRSVNSHQQISIIRGALSFIAPEVFHTRKFTQKSDVYSFGILMYLMATGEPPFRDRQLDASLIREIMDGLRPPMPDSAPEEYKKLVERCCDTDPDKRPDAKTLWNDIYWLIKKGGKGQY